MHTGSAAGDLPEIGVFDLHRHRPPGMPAASASRPHLGEHRLQHRADLVPLRQVAGKGVLRTNGLAHPICLDRSLVVATCHAVVVVRCLAEVPGQEVERLCPQVKTGADAEAVHLGRGHRAHAVELANRQLLHEGRPHLRGDDEQPVRFAVIGGELGQELVVRHARRRTVLHRSVGGRSSAVPSHRYGRRTYSGRPSSSIRFSALTAIATSVARRRSVRDRRPSPMTRLKRLMSASTRARQL